MEPPWAPETEQLAFALGNGVVSPAFHTLMFAVNTSGALKHERAPSTVAKNDNTVAPAKRWENDGDRMLTMAEKWA